MIPDPERLLAFVLVVTTLIAVPGPSVLFVVSRGVTLGPRAAAATAVGNEAGLLVQAVAVAAGLAALVAASQLLFTAIKLVGAAYLIHLGVQAWRGRRALSAGLSGPGAATPARPATRRVLREGFIVGVSNPKGLLIFSAVLPQFVDPAAGSVAGQLLALGVICVLIALVTDTAWGVLAGAARTWLGRSARRLEFVGGAAGVVMVGLGVRLALSSRQA
jgi:threonine/homoserine/homoserine lactone efflux protein